MLIAGCSPSDGEPGLTVRVGDDVIELDVDDTSGQAAQIQRVVMVGDSITKGSLPNLEERFAALDLPVTINAENGKRMAVAAPNNPSGAEIAALLAAEDDGAPAEEVWVVALGTNDAGQYGSPDEIAAAVNEVLDQVPDEAALVWVDTFIANRTDDSDAVNDIIRDRVERRGDAVVAPWSELAGNDGVLGGDAIHPTSAGSDVFASLVVDTVAAYLGR